MAMVQIDSRTWVNIPATANGTTTIDGYIFAGMSYIEAVTKWFELREDPAYTALPPVTSVSASVTVSGSVEEPVAPVVEAPVEQVAVVEQPHRKRHKKTF